MNFIFNNVPEYKNPFGMQIKNRAKSFMTSNYSFKYQGYLSNDETGTSYTTQFRELDSRIGRWMAVDPKAGDFPWQSPYVSMDNKPCWLIDPTGANTIHDPDAKGGEGSLVDQLEVAESQNSGGSERKVIHTQSYESEVTIHGFKYEPEDKGHVVGIDYIHTNITRTKQILYDDGSSGFETLYITYHAEIDRYGVATDVTMTYWQNVNGTITETKSVNFPMDQTPENFQTLFTAAFEFKNNEAYYQKSWIQQIADENAEINSDVKSVASGVGYLAKGISYYPPAKGVAKVIGYIAKGTKLIIPVINSEDPLEITVRLHKITKRKDEQVVDEF